MARDPRKNSAFDSGLRGREKPKASSGGGESKQGPNSTVGTPDGASVDAFSSGMRGSQKPASGAATQHVEGTPGGENKQGVNTVVGQPSGHDDAGQGKRAGIDSGHFQAAAKSAHDLGAAGSNNSTEHAASQSHPMGEEGILGEEDDTHINVRIPKASLKRKAPGVQGN